VTGISPEAMSLLNHYWWPGNIRELEHAIERALALTPHPVIFPEDLPHTIQSATVQAAAQARGGVTLAELEKDHILRVLEAHNQDLGQAAAIFGINRKTFLRKLRYLVFPAEDRLSSARTDRPELQKHDPVVG